MICSTSLAQLPGFGITRIAIACGVFDGLHIGHQAIIRTVVDQANKYNAEPILITFDPHPEEVVNPREVSKLLYSRQHQLSILSRLEIAVAVVLPFTKALASLQPEEFLKKMILRDSLDITSICVGEKWRFGFEAKGNTNELKKFGKKYNFNVVTVPEITLNGMLVSSTRVRKAIKDGDLELASKILGRRFSIMGKVEFGKGIATSQLECPTANISSKNEIFPPSGVYAARACITSSPKKKLFKDGVLYLGESPTYMESPPKKPFVEFHIFDFKDEIYGQVIEVELLKFMREDRKFKSEEELRRQILEDIDLTKELLKLKKYSPSELSYNNEICEA